MNIFSLIGLMILLNLGMPNFLNAQDEPRIFDINASKEIYTYETSLNLGTNVLIRLMVPHYDTIYVANRTWFSNKKALNNKAECVFNELNPNKVSIDSIVLFMVERDSMRWGTILTKTGQSKILNRFFILHSGDTLVVREVFRRNFECSANIWFMIRPTMSVKDF